MIGFDLDFRGLIKVIVMGLAAVIVVWLQMHDRGGIAGILMWLLALYYCWESHFHYRDGWKPYNRLGGQMKKAVNR